MCGMWAVPGEGTWIWKEKISLKTTKDTECGCQYLLCHRESFLCLFDIEMIWYWTVTFLTGMENNLCWLTSRKICTVYYFNLSICLSLKDHLALSYICRNELFEMNSIYLSFYLFIYSHCCEMQEYILLIALQLQYVGHFLQSFLHLWYIYSGFCKANFLCNRERS